MVSLQALQIELLDGAVSSGETGVFLHSRRIRSSVNLHLFSLLRIVACPRLQDRRIRVFCYE